MLTVSTRNEVVDTSAMDKTPHNLAQMRKSYEQAELDEAQVLPKPIAQFHRWFDEAVRVRALEPNAMTLATVGAKGRPSTRVLLLKGADEHGLVWYTNYSSRKGQELEVNPVAAMQFYWPELERVVRIEGPVERLSKEESDAYYRSRPLGSRIGAWASPQSQAIASRSALEDAWQTQQSLLGDDPPRPDHWGGHRLVPDRWEFWQGRASRLHDRIVYKLQADGSWAIQRLAP